MIGLTNTVKLSRFYKLYMYLMKKTIAVIFGGQSAEHDVSIITAHIPIIQSLLASGQFTVLPIYIAKNGCWYSDPEMNRLAFFKDPEFESSLKGRKKIQILFDDGLKIIWPGITKKVASVDIVFPAMHGTFGEDGSLMGLLRMANVAFVGCDLSSSAVAMDKVLTKQVLAAEGIPVVPYVWFTHDDWKHDKQSWVDKVSQLAFPVFVKPVHLGSSIAITKVREKEHLGHALELAFHYDNKVLIEQSVENLVEVTLPIMGNERLELAQIEQPLNKSDFFDFNNKYLSGGKNSGVNSQYSELPAKITPELSQAVRDLGKQAYRILGCSGIARVDFLIDGQCNNIYVNEVNTLPGSLYHHNWRSAGVSGVELVTKLITLAEEKFKKQKNITHTFNSEILKQLGGPKLG